MDDEPEVIRQQMEATRTDMTKKIEALEQQVVGTVQQTTQAVSETVESVKEAVQETVETVKDTFSGTVDSVKETMADTMSSVKEALDLRGYVQEYPWASFGAAVATGFVGGLLMEGDHRARRRIADLHSYGEPASDHGHSEFNGSRSSRRDYTTPASASSYSARPTETGPSWLHQLTEQFAPEVDKVKGLAIGALGALVRDFVTQSASGQLGGQLSQVIDDFTRKLGGEPIRGSLFPSGTSATGKSSRDRETASEARPTAAHAG